VFNDDDFWFFLFGFLGSNCDNELLLDWLVCKVGFRNVNSWFRD
jgi:hypothetical protein